MRGPQPTENDLLNELKIALSMFGPAREHVKTLYFEWALVTLSQLILYAAIPALAVAIMLAAVDAGTLPQHPQDREHDLADWGCLYRDTTPVFLACVVYFADCDGCQADACRLNR